MAAEAAENKTAVRGVSLFPDHFRIVESCAQELRLRGRNTFSPAIQFILEDWRDLRDMLALLPEAEREALRREIAARRQSEPSATV
jgi:hypothetical protein